MERIKVKNMIILALGTSLFMNIHVYFLKGINANTGSLFLERKNILIQFFGALVILFQLFSIILKSLKPIYTHDINDQRSPHLLSCFDPSRHSFYTLGSSRMKTISDLPCSETFCAYLKDPPRH
ncbi:hypothetical protein FG386_001416 [Cryptosporidium ryanae]|uniref:uncharacterized protein n=1 Tax=Cryptosporidium ryanae TaxID=515981 RepID=UPI00351A180A|nr:hypothetical protein FG386_001416 [Cryptosporidium ryanae]